MVSWEKIKHNIHNLFREHIYLINLYILIKKLTNEANVKEIKEAWGKRAKGKKSKKKRGQRAKTQRKWGLFQEKTQIFIYDTQKF